MTFPATEPRQCLMVSQITAIHRLVWTGLLAALMAAGAAITIPLGPLSPVPVTLQTLFVQLAGLVLGPRGGLMAVGLYLLAGALGLPVFSGGKGGLAVLFGPTGGFLWGFLPAVVCCGLASGKADPPAWMVLGYCFLGTSVLLVFGAFYLALVTGISPGKAFAVGALPFLPGAVAKCLVSLAVYRFLAKGRLLPQ